ncbi:diacylglycerol kinase family enzyme [Mycobacteroides chelonae]|nr:diacylglycerol kinase family enzyme [Mycobacteroides chelonae]
MFVVVNPSANGGTARNRWHEIEHALRERVRDIDVCQEDSALRGAAAIHAAVDRGARSIVAVGGDGSVGLALNALMDSATDQPRNPSIRLGAIGLGSSNDFHKPFGDRIAGAPARIDAQNASLTDVGKATLLLPDGRRSVRYFLINASMGLVAEGNHSFTAAGGVAKWLKPRNVEMAIAYTALKSVAQLRPLHVEIRSDGWSEDVQLTNVGVLKSPYFAGGMRYDTGVASDDGQFDVNIWAAASRPAVVRLIAGLYRGKFTSSPLATCRRGRVVDIRPERPSPLELDGEITVVESAHLEVIPKALLVCA